jgi:hypothetical protein
LASVASVAEVVPVARVAVADRVTFTALDTTI